MQNRPLMQSIFSSLYKNQLSKGYHVHFMKGRSNDKLSSINTQKFAEFINEDSQSNSFLIYDNTSVKSKIENWSKNLPWIKPHYAVKANPINQLLEDIYQSKQCGFDCASKNEIRSILKLGCNPSDIVFSNSVKLESEIDYAYRKGVRYTTADSIDELLKIQKVAPKMKILWRIAIKENSQEGLATVFSNKFGDDINSVKQAEERFTQIRKMGIKLHGIHFHCGSGQHGSSSFKQAINIANACMEIGRKCGHKMDVLDLGGGYPASHLSESQIDVLKATKNDQYRVIAEPGRHFSQESCHLAVRVIGKRSKMGKTCYHVNDGLYHSFNLMLMDGVSFENQQDQFYFKTDRHGQQTQNDTSSYSSIFGQTCDGADIIANNLLTPNLEVNDWIVLGGMGAYSVGPSSEFNGMESLSKIIVWNKQQEKQTIQESYNIQQIHEQKTL